jgi:hypothetical protein
MFLDWITTSGSPGGCNSIPSASPDITDRIGTQQHQIMDGYPFGSIATLTAYASRLVTSKIFKTLNFP